MDTSAIKRFSVTSLIKDREYDLTSGEPKSRVLYFTANPNSESEIVCINLDSKSKTKNAGLERSRHKKNKGVQVTVILSLKSS